VTPFDHSALLSSTVLKHHQPRHPKLQSQSTDSSIFKLQTFLSNLRTKFKFHHVLLRQLRSRLPWPHQPKQWPLCRLYHTQPIEPPFKQRIIIIRIFCHERSFRITRRYSSRVINLMMNKPYLTFTTSHPSVHQK
jgi:hypothetical protein